MLAWLTSVCHRRPMGIRGLTFLFVFLLPTLLAVVALYWTVRLAVRHALRDSHSEIDSGAHRSSARLVP